MTAIEEEEQRRREQMSCPNAAVSPVQDQINDAIRKGDSGAAIRMLEADESLIRACDRDGATPLHVAAQAMDEEMVAWLLVERRQPEQAGIHGLTPLDRAALAADPRNDAAPKFPAVARLLLDRGAEVTLYAAVALADAQRIREMVGADPGRRCGRSIGGRAGCLASPSSTGTWRWSGCCSISGPMWMSGPRSKNWRSPR